MERKIGVYICHCGTNIAATVDVATVAEYARGLPAVAVARHYEHMCAEPGLNMIQDDIKQLGLNRVVVAACSPTMHEPTFSGTCEKAGLNRYLFQMANIREHCSWITDDTKKATEKAKALVSAAVKRVYLHEPLVTKEVPANPNTLVVGGGIAGIQAALTIADSGYKVYLVEREPSIGGKMAEFDKTFPTLDCAACILTPKMSWTGHHPHIQLITNSEVVEVSGYIGNFKVKVRRKARYVDAEKCTGCSICWNMCPATVSPSKRIIKRGDEVIKVVGEGDGRRPLKYVSKEAMAEVGAGRSKGDEAHAKNEIHLKIDGREIVAKEGMTVLEAARGVGIDIPTLCYHPALGPSGACRLCTVEITSEGKSRLLASCVYRVKEGIRVETKSEAVIKARRERLEFLLARMPEAKVLQDLALKYGVKKPEATAPRDEFCINCRLCERMCKEVVGASVIEFTKQEGAIITKISSESCIGCGACAKVCPTGLITLKDINGRQIIHSEATLGPNTPIRVPFSYAIPNVPTINTDQCIYFKTGKCKVCERFCDKGAINHEMEDKYEEIEVGSIIIATGFQQFDPSTIYQYGYERYDNVLTGLEFERMSNAGGPTAGKIYRTDGKEPKSVAILHCVGSRDKHYHEYCSRVCCMYSLKYSHLIREKIPDAKIYQLYIDLRCFGKGYEEFYNRLQEEGVNFIRGRAAEVTNIAETMAEKGRLVVLCEDTLAGVQRRIPVDMVILSCALEPQANAEEVARVFKISRSADGFFLEKHPKLDPVATASNGIYVTGCCQGPKDIPDTVAQASAAAALALSTAVKGKVEIEAAIAVVDEKLCAGCKVCNSLCPYTAISFDVEKKVSRVNEALCKGCGTCGAACPSSAITARHFVSEQIMAEIEGVLV